MDRLICIAWLKAFCWVERLHSRFGWDPVNRQVHEGLFRLYEWTRGKYFDAYYRWGGTA